MSMMFGQPEIEDAEIIESSPVTTDTTVSKILGVDQLPTMTQEQGVEAMAARFEHEGFKPDDLRRMAAQIARKVRTDATKPPKDKVKAKNRNMKKLIKSSKRKNRK